MEAVPDEVADEVADEVEKEVGPPGRYAVVLHNDDYTTMEFVMEVLMEVFRKTLSEAEAIMLSVHRFGKGIAGIYSLEIAETKAEQVRERARAEGFPLQVTVEKQN